jgi:hypothetical protein
MSKGGMQSIGINTANYCPECNQVVWVGYPRMGYYSHMTQKGNILLCDISRNLKRKRITSDEWQEIMKKNNRR